MQSPVLTWFSMCQVKTKNMLELRHFLKYILSVSFIETCIPSDVHISKQLRPYCHHYLLQIPLRCQSKTWCSPSPERKERSHMCKWQRHKYCWKKDVLCRIMKKKKFLHLQSPLQHNLHPHLAPPRHSVSSSPLPPLPPNAALVLFSQVSKCYSIKWTLLTCCIHRLQQHFKKEKANGWFASFVTSCQYQFLV